MPVAVPAASKRQQLELGSPGEDGRLPRALNEMKKTNNRLCLLLALCGLCSASFGGQLFQERFWNLSRVDKDLGARNLRGSDVDKGPYLDVTPKAGRSGFLLLANAPGAPVPPQNVNNFDLWFKFRHHGAVSNRPSCFDLALLSADKTKTQLVRIATDRIAGHPIRRNPTDEWSRFVLQARGEKASLYYAPYGPVAPIGEIPLEGRFAWANILVTDRNGFGIADLTVTTPSDLPADPSARQFASFRSISQPVAGRIAPKGGADVSLTPAPRAGIRFAPGPVPFQFHVHHRAPSGSKEPGRVSVHDVYVVPQHLSVKGHVIGLEKGAETNLPNGSIEISGIIRQAVRPSFDMYQTYWSMVRKGYDLLRAWDTIPPATDHPLDIDFVRRADGRGLDVYLDGSLSKTLPVAAATEVTNIVFHFPEGVRYAVKEDPLAKVDTGRYTCIDLSVNPRAKALVDAECDLKPGLHDFSGVPVIVAKPIDSADGSICKQALGGWALEVESYHGRAPRHGFPSAIHYRLPAAPFVRAHLLFALDPDPRKERFLTVRMAHYVTYGSGANMIADSVIDLRDGRMAEGLEKVGTIRMDGTNLPVYRAEVTLDLGKILDVVTGEKYDSISSGGYIDFELLGKCGEGGGVKPEENSDSAFNILGVTLEKMPVRIAVRQAAVANVFCVGEAMERKMDLIVTATDPAAKGSVSWTIRDSEGEELVREKRGYDLAAIGASNLFSVVLGDEAPVGHYPFEIVFADATGKNRLTHRGAFAILPPEARMVDKFDSPYGTWWFSVHGSPAQAEIGGPLMRKAGIVRNSFNKTLKPEDYEKYRLTGKRVHHISFKVDREKCTLLPRKIDDIEKPAEEAAELQLRRALEEDPTIDTVMLWHESAPTYGIPEELLGLPVPTNTIAKDKAFAIQVDAAGRVVRKVSKDLKHELRLQIGNSSASIGAVVRPLRAGADPGYYDQIGMETPSQSIPPEFLSEVGLQGMVVAREAAEYYAKRPVALNGCWEYTYRCERNIGGRQLAEWYMRDTLISLANRMRYIAPGTFFDCKNGYYNTLWGASGILDRGPFGYPKEAYVAYAVLTSVLDGVTFVRQIDTGSTTVYALEFKRMDGKVVTALWAARGEVLFEIDSRTKGTATHMLGATERVGKRRSKIWGGTSPTYVVTDKPLRSVRIAKRAFREDEGIARLAKVAWAIDDVSQVTLEPDPRYETKHTRFLPILKPSAFTVKQVEDDEKGACIEVALDLGKNQSTSRYITEYTTLRFKEPKAVPGKPVILGVWVKGNSNWGKIRFEIEDAKGEIFKNTTIDWGCDCQDWPANLAVNFDGWGYVYAALDENSFFTERSPGTPKGQWVSMGKGDRQIDFPIKVKAITIPMNRTKLDLLDFKPSAPSIRLKDVGGTADPVE